MISNLRTQIASMTLALIVVVGISHVFLLPAIEDFVERFRAKPTTGQIFVDSPELYTRERLVNDRFQQDAWLTSQLKATDRIFSEFRFQGTMNVSRASQTNLRVGRGDEENKGSDPNSPPGRAEADTPTSSSIPKPRFVEELSDKLEFRNRVRTEILENQLDDRHDLNGNTLLRLKFDATIFPDRNTSASAVVLVSLQNMIPPDAINTPYDRIAAQGARADLYLSWLDKLEDNLRIAASNVRSALQNDQLEFELAVQLQEILLEDLQKSTSEVNEPAELTRKLYKKSLLDFVFRNAVDIHKNRPLFATRPDLHEKYEDFGNFRSISINSNFCPLDTYRTFLNEHRYIAKPQLSQNSFMSLVVKTFRPPHDQMFQPVPSELPKTLLPAIRLQNCPRFPTPSHLTELVAAHVSEKLKQDPETLMSRAIAVYFSNKANISLGRLAKIVADKCSAAGCSIRVQLPIRGVDFEQLRVPDHFQQHHPYQQSRYDVLSQLKLLLLDERFYELVDVFYAALEPKEFVYSYAVTPKDSAQQILDTRITAAASRLGLVASPPNSSSIALDSAEELRKISQAARRHPLIVGFSDSKSSSSIADTTKRTIFGWIISSPFNSNDKEHGSQVVQQSSLVSVVSVPGWWRQIKLRVATCWISNTEQSDGQFSSFADCKDALTKDPSVLQGPKIRRVDYPLLLPADPTNASRAFGFQYPRTPYVKIDPVSAKAPLAYLNVGLPGAIMLRGGRLWRSATVTIGAQPADEIVVLPNMEGIIARFFCIQSPSQFERDDFLRQSAQEKVASNGTGGIEERPRKARIIVWTSEGDTEPGYALVGDPRRESDRRQPACSEDGRPLQSKPETPTSPLLLVVPRQQSGTPPNMFKAPPN